MIIFEMLRHQKTINNANCIVAIFENQRSESVNQ
jgi:hypothetical protein